MTCDFVYPVIGFGATKENGLNSFSLQEVIVNTVPHNQCNKAYDGKVQQQTMFCAGVDKGGRDSCQGDSGTTQLVTRFLLNHSNGYK